MKILVTGSAGHLGEGLVRSLRERGDSVRSTDLKTSPWTDRVGDLRDAQFVRDCLAGVDAVIHAATLHKPHVATHSKQDFIDSNVSATLNLLEASVEEGVDRFLFTSTTSVFGGSMDLPEDAREAVWVDESLASIPRNIYGVTKKAAEDLCRLFYVRHGLPALVLRTSRFFAEQDDNIDRRREFDDANLKANELLFRRADLADMVSAHLCGLERAPQIGFGRYVITATTPFQQEDREALLLNAPAVVAKYYPEFEAIYRDAGWRMFPAIGRVYVNDAARRELGWSPRYDFSHAIACQARGERFGSALAEVVGKKPYHDTVYEDGPYPVDEGAQGHDAGRLG